MPKCLVTMLSNPDRKRIIHMNRSRSAAPRTPLASTTLNVTITDLVAEYVLRHSFENDGSAPIEAVFTFPVPLDAAFVGLRATIAGETLCAQIQAKRQASETYGDAIAQGHSAVLLSAPEPGVLCTSLDRKSTRLNSSH